MAAMPGNVTRSARTSSRWMFCSPMVKRPRLRASEIHSSFARSWAASAYWASSRRSPSSSSVSLPGTSTFAGGPRPHWPQYDGPAARPVPLYLLAFVNFCRSYALFPEGVETFQAFVPRQHSKEIFAQVLRYSQQQDCLPIWCIVKQHRRDPFLLSYQVDGFSLELNYQRTHQTARTLEPVLRHMIATVIEAGGRFYLAKDRLLTHAQYRQSVGDDVVDTFLRLKQRYDSETLLQS